jgi:hypothetical protein
VAPTNPTWEHDIHPLLVARCIRCHQGKGNVDPVSKGPPLYDFSYATFDPSSQPMGIMVLRMFGVQAVRGGFARRMPPPPAEALEDWQIEMLETWIKNPK